MIETVLWLDALTWQNYSKCLPDDGIHKEKGMELDSVTWLERGTRAGPPVIQGLALC
jgi:hypothetical protein